MATEVTPKNNDKSPTEQVAILKFVNDYKMEIERLRIRTFYLFHRCEFRCLKDVDASGDAVESCLKHCEQQLANFFKARKELMPTNIEQVYGGISLVKPELAAEYTRLAWETKHKLEDYV